MKTKSTKITQQNQTIKNQKTLSYSRNPKHSRPVYFQDEFGSWIVERYLSYDHVRDEARSATAKIIRHARRENYGVHGFCSDYLKAISLGIRGRAWEILDQTPIGVADVAIKSLCDYEEDSGKPIHRILSIRPVIGKDRMGYYLKSVKLIDTPRKIKRIYKGNEYNDAF